MIRVFLLMFFLQCNSFAQDIHDFFDKGTLIIDYDTEILKLNPGDGIILDNDTILENISIIPTDGQNSIIIKGEINGKTQVLRLPKTSTRASMLNEYIDGEKVLIENGLNIAGINRFKRNCFVLQDFHNFEYSAVDLFLREDIDEKLISTMVEKLREANFNFSKFKEIGDFKWEQLLWDKETQDWILLDWDNSSKIAIDPINNNFLVNHLTVDAVRLSEIIPDEKLSLVRDRISFIKNKITSKFKFEMIQLLKSCIDK